MLRTIPTVIGWAQTGPGIEAHITPIAMAVVVPDDAKLVLSDFFSAFEICRDRYRDAGDDEDAHLCSSDLEELGFDQLRIRRTRLLLEDRNLLIGGVTAWQTDGEAQYGWDLVIHANTINRYRDVYRGDNDGRLLPRDADDAPRGRAQAGRAAHSAAAAASSVDRSRWRALPPSHRAPVKGLAQRCRPRRCCLASTPHIGRGTSARAESKTVAELITAVEGDIVVGVATDQARLDRIEASIAGQRVYRVAVGFGSRRRVLTACCNLELVFAPEDLAGHV